MDGFERRRSQKKEAILSAALELFKQYGFNKVSIADIAAKAAVSQVSIYNFFQSKENLKNELLKNLWEEYYQAIMSVSESDNTVYSKIEKIFHMAVDYARNYTPNFMISSIRSQMAHEEITTDMQLKSIQQVISGLLTQGQREGVIKSDVSIDAMQLFLEIFRFYIFYNQDAIATIERNPELYKDMVAIYLKALFT